MVWRGTHLFAALLSDAAKDLFLVANRMAGDHKTSLSLSRTRFCFTAAVGLSLDGSINASRLSHDSKNGMSSSKSLRDYYENKTSSHSLARLWLGRAGPVGECGNASHPFGMYGVQSGAAWAFAARNSDLRDGG
jgi:hypothetical protein